MPENYYSVHTTFNMLKLKPILDLWRWKNLSLSPKYSERKRKIWQKMVKKFSFCEFHFLLGIFPSIAHKMYHKKDFLFTFLGKNETKRLFEGCVGWKGGRLFADPTFFDLIE